MDVKLVNPFIDAFTTVLPQMGFPTPERTGMGVQDKHINSRGVAVLVGFTKEIRGNVVYNMDEETAKFIASTMMMGMPVADFDEMAQSAISEMSNMLTVTAATNLASLCREVDISTPSLTVGAGAGIRISGGQFLTVTMDMGGHIVEIDIAVE